MSTTPTHHLRSDWVFVCKIILIEFSSHNMHQRKRQISQCEQENNSNNIDYTVCFDCPSHTVYNVGDDGYYNADKWHLIWPNRHNDDMWGNCWPDVWVVIITAYYDRLSPFTSWEAMPKWHQSGKVICRSLSIIFLLLPVLANYLYAWGVKGSGHVGSGNEMQSVNETKCPPVKHTNTHTHTHPSIVPWRNETHHKHQVP